MTIRVQTTVLPGGKIEIETPQLTEGQSVDVTIDVPFSTGLRPGQQLLEFFRSLPPIPRTTDDWNEIDREIRAERDAWD
jgi:hypothetical protein